jgi:hypothetical protein
MNREYATAPMYASTFIFAKGEWDDEFYRLDEQIAAAAKATPGYLVVISQVLRTYGDGQLAGRIPTAGPTA